MFNPAQFLSSRQPNGYFEPPRTQYKRIVIDNLQEACRSKWDQPIVLPSVLYSKFKVPLPHSQKKKQAKIYPQTLLDFIKRAYERCRDEESEKLMEKELRKVIANFQDDLESVAWDTYPIPLLKAPVPPSRPSAQRNAKPQAVTVRRGSVHLPSCYNIVDEENDKPSKAKIMAQKRWQKIEKKLNNEDQPVQPKQEQQFFIGFQSKPDPSVVKPQPAAPVGHKMSFPPPPSADQINKKIPPISTKKLSRTEETSEKPLVKENRAGKADKQKKRKAEKQKEKREKREKREEKEKEKEKKEEKEREKKEEKGRRMNTGHECEQKAVKGSSEGRKKSPIHINRKQLQLISKCKDENEKLGQVARRFTEFNKMTSLKVQKDDMESDEDLNLEEALVGRNQTLEKGYLRITGRPDPSKVRPESVLKKALMHFLNRYKKGCEYEYLISQFKSIRQDLTVQHIKNCLTVQVYQENMRISLFEDDIAQFKHCQTTLWQLYCQGLFYSHRSREHYMSYQMITLIMEGKFQDMEFMLTQVPSQVLISPSIQSTLRLKRLIMLRNYRGFFDFVATQDTFTRRLLNLYMDKVRIKCLLMVCKTFGEKISIKSLAELLNEDEDLLEGIIKEEKGVLENGYLLLKQSYDNFAKSEHLVTRKVTVKMG